MSHNPETVTVTIDNQILNVPKGQTILQAAQRHDIYIPTLCAHKELTPFGGCRMCIVEVDKMRGFPTSCTTPSRRGWSFAPTPPGAGRTDRNPAPDPE